MRIVISCNAVYQYTRTLIGKPYPLTKISIFERTENTAKSYKFLQNSQFFVERNLLFPQKN